MSVNRSEIKPKPDALVAQTKARRVYVLFQVRPSIEVLATADSFERLVTERQILVDQHDESADGRAFEWFIGSGNHLTPIV